MLSALLKLPGARKRLDQGCLCVAGTQPALCFASVCLKAVFDGDF